MQKRLQRSRIEKMVAGVCGGLAEYFSVDPTLVRAVFAVVTVLGGSGGAPLLRPVGRHALGAAIPLSVGAADRRAIPARAADGAVVSQGTDGR